MTTLYKLLNDDAKSWWYHKKLRERGQIEEARKRERASILSSVRRLRNAHYFSVGKGGWTIHEKTVDTGGGCTSKARTRHYGGIDAPQIQCCIMLGIPGYCVSNMPDKAIWAGLRLPIIDDRRDEPGPDGKYNSLTYAPLDYVFAKMRGLGAEIYNWQ